MIPILISRLSGAAPGEVSQWLNDIADGISGGIEAQFVKLGIQSKPKSEDLATAAQRSIAEFRAAWKDLDAKLAMCPAKDVISGLNSLLQSNGYRTVSARSLASNVRSDELDREMVDVLADIEYTMSGAH